MDEIIKKLLKRKIDKYEHKITDSEKETILQLAKTEDINKQNAKTGWTYLHMAIIFEDWELIDLLLQIENINLLVVDKQDLHILFFAMTKKKNTLQLIKCLAKHHNQDAVYQLLLYKNKKEQTALHIAILNKAEAVALAIIAKFDEKDVNPEIKQNKISALHYAIAKREKTIALALINNLEVKDDDILVALRFAIDQKETTVALALIAKTDVKKINTPQMKNGWTTLHLAIIRNETKVALALIAKLDTNDLNIDLKAREKSTVLPLAIFKKETQIALALIAKLDAKDLRIQAKKDGWTVLHHAIDNKQTQIALALIAKLDIKDLRIQAKKDGWTPLHHAINNKQTAITLALINKLKTKDLSIQIKENGWTPLHHAIVKAEVEVALTLINKLDVKNLTSKSNNKVNPLHLAIAQKKEQIALAIIDKLTISDLMMELTKKRKSTTLHLAIIQKEKKIVFALINKLKTTNLTIQAQNTWWDTLQIAVDQKAEAVVLALIEQLQANFLSVDNLQQVQQIVPTANDDAISNSQNCCSEIVATSSTLLVANEHHDYQNLNLPNPWFSDDNLAHNINNSIINNNNQSDNQYLRTKKEKKIPKFQQATKKKTTIMKTKKKQSPNCSLPVTNSLTTTSNHYYTQPTNQHNLIAIDCYLKEQAKIKKQQLKNEASKHQKDNKKTKLPNQSLAAYIESTIGLPQKEFEEQYSWIQTILIQKQAQQISDENFNEKIKEKIKENDEKQLILNDFETQKIKKIDKLNQQSTDKKDSIPIMILIRNERWDHEKGRPALVLGEYQDQILVIPGTTQQKINWLDECYQQQLNDKTTYFYFKNLTKVSRANLKGLWKNNAFVNTTDNNMLFNNILQCANLKKLSESEEPSSNTMDQYCGQSCFEKFKKVNIINEHQLLATNQDGANNTNENNQSLFKITENIAKTEINTLPLKVNINKKNQQLII